MKSVDHMTVEELKALQVIVREWQKSIDDKIKEAVNKVHQERTKNNRVLEQCKQKYQKLQEEGQNMVCTYVGNITIPIVLKLEIQFLPDQLHKALSYRELKFLKLILTGSVEEKFNKDFQAI